VGRIDHIEPVATILKSRLGFMSCKVIPVDRKNPTLGKHYRMAPNDGDRLVNGIPLGKLNP